MHFGNENKNVFWRITHDIHTFILLKKQLHTRLQLEIELFFSMSCDSTNQKLPDSEHFNATYFE